jgi:mono/diheme cytochrome c family protein
VKLTTQPNGQGTVLATLTTDNSGNIRSSSSISFGTGLYVSASGTAGTKYMAAAIANGACSACHGSTTAKVWVE